MSAEVSQQQPHDRHRRKAFSTIFRRLANLKSSSHSRNANPQADGNHHSGVSFSETPSRNGGGNGGGNGHSISLHHRRRSGEASTRPPTQSTSTAYSSPSQSLRSLTTLTTVQSTAPPSTYLANGQQTNYNPHANHHHNPNGPDQLFSHQYPTHSPHASTSTSAGPSTPAVFVPPAPPVAYSSYNSNSNVPSNTTTPGAFTPGPMLLQPSTYNNLTSGGMLTDNASIITIASSSKRRRRSLDTDASIRAVAPSSLWGGSRESLPLSVLSGGMDARTQGDRASLYSTTLMGGAASIKDRDSVAGLMIGGSPLVSPRDGVFPNVGVGAKTADGPVDEASAEDNNNSNSNNNGSIGSAFVDKGKGRRPSTGTSLVGTVESVVELDPDVPEVPVLDREKHDVDSSIRKGKSKAAASPEASAEVPDARA